MRDFQPLKDYQRGYVFADFDFFCKEEQDLDVKGVLENEGVSLIRRKRFVCGRDYYGRKKYAYDISWKYKGDDRVYHLDVDLQMQENPQEFDWKIEHFDLRISQGYRRIFVGCPKDIPNTREGRVAIALSFFPKALIHSGKSVA
ncbi:hypothetical protein ISTM_369 [Insectomime virus]|uniref:Uncharacterized protein n=1 Tax=Tunisvirus fontaine2 TaxID=1421067 RepID=V9SGW6_9VIRU|nr:hypothetical protein D1R32_gp432 [Tunisvirus fontaine2]AHA46267.1 hypothetical protein ISTM_369 [Insectomime virus]AHC55149.1 hypothetical protein TNS_ORF431 [Tunisvirus fontaine2]